VTQIVFGRDGVSPFPDFKRCGTRILEGGVRKSTNSTIREIAISKIVSLGRVHDFVSFPVFRGSPNLSSFNLLSSLPCRAVAGEGGRKHSAEKPQPSSLQPFVAYATKGCTSPGNQIHGGAGRREKSATKNPRENE
jgi:hypothetical protein